MKRTIIWITLGTLIGLFLLFVTFEGSKRLSGTDFFLLDVNSRVSLCHYDGDWYSGTAVVNDIKQVFWDNKYIVVQGEGKYTDIYYIVEQLETDTIIEYDNGQKIFRNKQYWNPWITEEYKQYPPFCKRLQELNIDTTQMHHYSWKFWVGIY